MLMDNNTNFPAHDKAQERSASAKIAALGAFFVMVCIFFIIAFIGFQPDQTSLSDSYFPSPTATFTAENYKSNADALRNKWNALISDGFDDNHNQWQVGTTNKDNTEISSEISGGTYHWTVTVPEQSIHTIPISKTPLTDFYLTVDAKLANGLFSDDFGVILREDAEGNFYYFGVKNAREYAFLRFYNNHWVTLIDWTTSPDLLTSWFNKLTVVGQGSQFIFFINDQYTATFTDTKIAKGTTSLIVRVSRPESRLRLEFDNLLLSAP